MSAPKRWRVKRLGEAPADLYFPAGISEDEVKALYSDCHVQEAPGEALQKLKRDRSGGDDDET